MGCNPYAPALILQRRRLPCKPCTLPRVPPPQPPRRPVTTCQGRVAFITPLTGRLRPATRCRGGTRCANAGAGGAVSGAGVGVACRARAATKRLTRANGTETANGGMRPRRRRTGQEGNRTRRPKRFCRSERRRLPPRQRSHGDACPGLL